MKRQYKDDEIFFINFLKSDINSLREYSINNGVGNRYINRLPLLKDNNKELYMKVYNKYTDLSFKNESIARKIDLKELKGSTLTRSNYIDWIIENYKRDSILNLKCRELIFYAAINGVNIVDEFNNQNLGVV